MNIETQIFFVNIFSKIYASCLELILCNQKYDCCDIYASLTL